MFSKSQAGYNVFSEMTQANPVSGVDETPCINTEPAGLKGIDGHEITARCTKEVDYVYGTENDNTGAAFKSLIVISDWRNSLPGEYQGEEAIIDIGFTDTDPYSG